jgi:predicted transposase/invertase (TIGR01784 family)
MEFSAVKGHNNLLNRSLYYLSYLHSCQLNIGLQTYSSFAPTYQIFICDYAVFDDDSFFKTFKLCSIEIDKVVLDVMTSIIIELSKLTNLLTKNVSDLTLFLEMGNFF